MTQLKLIRPFDPLGKILFDNFLGADKVLEIEIVDAPSPEKVLTEISEITKTLKETNILLKEINTRLKETNILLEQINTQLKTLAENIKL